MTDEPTRNQKFLAQARTLPFWLYIGFGGLVFGSGAFLVEAAGLSPTVAFLGGILASEILDVPLDRLQSWAYERSDVLEEGSA